MNLIKIENIFSGKKEQVVDYKEKQYTSSYRKSILKEDVYVNTLGLENDTQTDTNHHGGIHKAVCVYPKGNYEYFIKKHGLILPMCSFGENITLLDIDDKDICLGDIYKCGEVIFEVSQPRQPCWKISSILGIKNMTSLVVKEFKTGFYLRVLKEGFINKDSTFELVSRVYDDINIEFINKAHFNSDINDIKKILHCKELAPAYRLSLEKKFKTKNLGLEEWQEDNYNI